MWEGGGFRPGTIDEVIAILERIRAQQPLVHCLTNQVVKNFTANVLLALGAAPAMVAHADDAAEFATMASALLVNLGTLDESQTGCVTRPAVLRAQRRARRAACASREARHDAGDGGERVAYQSVGATPTVPMSKAWEYLATLPEEAVWSGDGDTSRLEFRA
jgi:hydroxyethylthiazole kinase